jgi:hypothetical protein
MARSSVSQGRRRFPRLTVGLLLAGGLSASSVCVAGTASASVAHAALASHDAHLLLEATSSNTSGDTTYINNKLSNRNRNALVFVTANWNPHNAAEGIYDTAPLGVWYDSAKKKWGIFNEDGSDMAVGMAFNVLIVPKPTRDAFVHTSTTSSLSRQTTYIKNPATNKKPGVLLQVTQNWNPPHVKLHTNGHPVGVYFDRRKGKWGIFNEDSAKMTAGPSFNVLVGTSGTSARSAVLTASAGNTADDYVLYRNTRLNGRPNAEVFATAVYNPRGKHTAGNYLDSAIGIWFDNNLTTGVWSVFREDQASMPLGEGFNLLYYSG